MTHRCKGRTQQNHQCRNQIADKRRKYCHHHSRSRSRRGGGIVGDTMMGLTRGVGTVAGYVPGLGKVADIATGATLSGQRRFFGLFDKKYREEQY